MLSIYFQVYLSCVSTLEVEGGIHSWKQSAASTSCKEVEKKRRVSSPIQVNFYFEYVLFFDKPKRLLCQTCNLIQITINTKAKMYSTLNIFCARTAFFKKKVLTYFLSWCLEFFLLSIQAAYSMCSLSQRASLVA